MVIAERIQPDYKATEHSVGIFSVIHRAANYLPKEVRARLSLEPNDPVLQLHMHEAIEAENDLQRLLLFREGFPQVVKHIIAYDFWPKSVFGMTYERLAKGARLFGFKRMPIEASQLPEGEMEIIKEGYSKTRDFADGLPMGAIEVCYQSVGEFMGRFGSTHEKSVILKGINA